MLTQLAWSVGPAQLLEAETSSVLELRVPFPQPVACNSILTPPANLVVIWWLVMWAPS